MYVSWNWIGEFVDTTGIDPVEFADRFTLAVAEIEGVSHYGQGLDQVLVAQVTEVTAHPNADKLRLAHCDLGDTTVTVVCGAPDLRVGMVVPFVPPNVTLPSGITVRDGQVRGVDSPGMLASEADLGLSDDHDGLMDLAELKCAPGQAMIQYIALQDVLYEIDNKSITHRPDLWGQLGMAREVAALLRRPLLVPSTEVVWGSKAGPKVTLDDHASCRRYLSAELDHVSIAPSPLSIRMRLRSLGVRPINNVVDATNWVMLETGNPLHAFDAAQIDDDHIVIRRAEPTETMVTLDGEHRSLTNQDCVIASAQEPIALAGIMGGQNSEIRAETTRVLLESASFDGANIRKTASRLGVRTESSARFEKHLDPNTAAFAAHRFVRVLHELCPEMVVVSELVDCGPHVSAPPTPRVVETSRSYLRSRLGLSAAQLSDAWMDETLSSLEFEVTALDTERLAVTVPSFRAGRDVSIQEDLVEELGRIFGYDHIPSQAPMISAHPAALPAGKMQERRARAALALGEGLTEVVLYSFESDATRQRLGLSELDAADQQRPRLTLRNYLSSDMRHMRRCLSNNLLESLEYNLAQGTRAAEGHKGMQIGLFEIGRVFRPIHADQPLQADPGIPAVLTSDSERQTYLNGLSPALLSGVEQAERKAIALPSQPRHLALAIGHRLGGGQKGWVQPLAEVTRSLYGQAVGAIERLLRQMCLPEATFKKLDSTDKRLETSLELNAAWLHSARHAGIWIADRLVGVITMIHPDVRNSLDIPAEAVLAELDLEVLLEIPPVAERGQAPAKFPPSSFDLTLPCTSSVRTREVLDGLTLRLSEVNSDIEVQTQWVRDFFDSSDQYGRAMTLRMTCRRLDGSLSDNDILSVRSAAIDHLDACEGVRPNWGDEIRAMS
ncbi:MAG: phenylalanine--tRNA ligase subunit beta [Myxococcales bacterium]|nr:phenylalanine--tRNA ligase subunit beta [Myxococcales bacterium]